MTQAFSFSGKRVCLLGLGTSNQAMLDFLLAHGARVTVREERDKTALPISEGALRRRGVRLVCGKDAFADMEEEILFRSPGIRPDLPPLARAVARGAHLLCESQLFSYLSPARLLAVTGSDGKTTTTALSAHILTHARRDRNTRVALGGNIGAPLIAEADRLLAADFAVVELSSFQLMSPHRPPVRAAVTNISENHLNWHRGMSEYIDAKRSILGEGTHAVLNAENEITASFAWEREDRTLFSSRRTHNELTRTFGACHTVTEENGMLAYDGEPLFPASVVPLPGRHNLENVMAAVALTLPYVDLSSLPAAVASFSGVAHRLQTVASVGGVRYVDSSIDSTPTRTAAALSALSCTPILLCGGRGKGLSYAPLVSAVCGRVRALLLFGEAREDIARAMRKAGQDFSSFPSMREAVTSAKKIARCGDTVLLSPACTSFDEFRNFEDRGDAFCRLVKE